MPTIEDLSDQPQFTIHAIAEKTGIRPITLRAWERRHNILTPHRAANHYRLYSERDIAVLNWLKNRIDSGLSISTAASELRDLASKGLWPEAFPPLTGTDQPQKGPSGPVLSPAQYANQLCQALIHHEEKTALELLKDMLAAYHLKTVFAQIFVPCLHQIGDKWYHGEINITTEHFASAYLRGKLMTLFQSYPLRRGAPSILIGCAPTEQHELGSLMFAVLLRSSGYRVEYLGPDIPVEDLADYASYEHPDLIILSASLTSAALEMRRMQELLAPIHPRVLFAFGGSAFDQDPKLQTKIGGVYLGSTFDESLASVQKLLEKKNKNSKSQAEA